MKDHLKSHHKLKPYPCPWVKNSKPWPKDFNYKRDLNRCLRMHTNPELCCKFCDYKNVDKRNFMKHTRTRGSEERYNCSKCNRKFRFWMQLKRHTCNNSLIVKLLHVATPIITTMYITMCVYQPNWLGLHVATLLPLFFYCFCI